MDAQRHLHRDAAEEDEDEEPETDISTLLDREHQRLMRLYQDPRQREELEAERLHLQDYIAALAQVAVDSKFNAFQRRLAAVVAEGHRVIVFTQYLDTLDFIRNQLVARYGAQIACYSGRGGEIWDPVVNAWRVVDKAEIKARSRREHPHAMQILLGTDAASEGLNLQQFSALINYDLPWNPMRVEQRIGRIDRIGQEAPTVKILNLYMQGTIEEDAYYILRHRIRAFEEVIGPLQPILAEMPRIFRLLARGEIEWPRRADAWTRLPGHNPMSPSRPSKRVCRKNGKACRWMAMRHRRSRRASWPPGASHTPPRYADHRGA